MGYAGDHTRRNFAPEIWLLSCYICIYCFTVHLPLFPYLLFMFTSILQVIRFSLCSSVSRDKKLVSWLPQFLIQDARIFSDYRISLAHDVWHCRAIEYGTTICWVLASGSTSFLFFQRVKSVYSDKKPIRWAFLLFLLVNVGISCLVPIGSHLGRLANTGYCVNTVEAYAAAPMFFRLAFDLGVFVAIAFRVATMQGLSGDPVPWSTILSRQSSSRMVRAALRSGQQYYL